VIEIEYLSSLNEYQTKYFNGTPFTIEYSENNRNATVLLTIDRILDKDAVESFDTKFRSYDNPNYVVGLIDILKKSILLTGANQNMNNSKQLSESEIIKKRNNR